MTNEMFSKDFKMYLQNLKRLIVRIELLNVTNNKENKKRAINNLKQLYNKMFLYNINQSKYLISVTGFQGAGKTSLIRDYFNIPEAILPENNARGERLPVFISSHEMDEVEAYKYKSEVIDGEIEIKPQKLDIKEVEDATKNPSENNDLWIELKIPKKDSEIKNSDVSIVLLPGYEKFSSDFSQKLLDFVVNISASSIIVVDKNSLARKSTNDILNKINNKFEDLRPIVAITHGDENTEQNEEVRKEVVSSLNIEDEKRVIITGPSKEFGGAWKTEITDNLNRYGEKGSEMFNASRESITDTLQDILRDIDFELDELSDVLENESNSLEIKDLTNERNNTADLFKNEYEKYLIKLGKELERQMPGFIKVKKEKLVDIVEEDTGFWKNLKVRLIGENIRNKQNVTKKLKKLWEDAEENNLNALKLMNNSATKVLDDYDNIYTLPEEWNKFELIEKKGTNSLNKINNYFSSDIEKEEFENWEFENLDLHDLKGLVYLGASFITHAFKTLENEEYQKSIEVLADSYESNKYYNSNTENSDNPDKNLRITIIDSPSTESLSEHERETYNTFSQNILKTVPLVLGVDVLSDGNFDFKADPGEGLNKISEGLAAIGINISSRTLLSVAGGGVAIAATSYAIKQNLVDLNKRQMSLYNNASLYIDTLAQSQIYNYLDSLRNMFEKIEEKLRYRYFQLTNNNEMASSIESCKYLLNKVQKQTTKDLERSYDEKLLF